MCASKPGRMVMRARGMSLLELMVGIVVSLLVGLAATTGAAMFNASSRQGSAVGASSINLDTAVSALRNEATSAGLGFFGGTRYLCDKMNLAKGGTVLMNGVSFSPLWLTQNSGNDSMDVMYGSDVLAGADVRVAAVPSAASAALASLLPVSVGQTIVLVPEDSSQPCTVRQVQAHVASTASALQTIGIADATGMQFNAGTFTTGTTLTTRSRITLLGELRWTRFRLDGTNLVLERPMDGTSAVLAHNVVALKVQYGLADAGSQSISTWVRPVGSALPVATSELERLRAVRIGVMVRAPQREKPDAGGTCTATPTMPQLFGETVTSDVSDFACYRYRTAITTVPLRNILLGLSAT